MFMGHYAPATLVFRDKHNKNRIKLWQGFLAVQSIDIVFAVLVLFGLEDSIIRNNEPIFEIAWSHSLLSALLISIGAALIFKSLLKLSGINYFWLLFGLVFSHWVLDFLVHRPDLPLHPLGDNFYGLGLWNYPWPSYILEVGILFLGFLYWIRQTIPNSAFYKFAPWALFILMSWAQFIFITLPGLQVRNGTFDAASHLQGLSLGFSCLFTFIILAALIAAIERGRTLKPSQSSST